MVTGHGAGFMMCWQNDVRWSIAQHDDPKKFMTVDSGDYVLAIPDFRYYAQQSEAAASGGGSISFSSSYKAASFQKVIMKLSGNVQWLAGLVFERDLDSHHGTFDFKPHYEVVLKHPDYAKTFDNKVSLTFIAVGRYWSHSFSLMMPSGASAAITFICPSP
jgi:hydrogenase maturation factor HypF (carbamoyltransferase family)